MFRNSSRLYLFALMILLAFAAAVMPPAEASSVPALGETRYICALCPVQQGETCAYAGQPCGFGGGCTCKGRGSAVSYCCI